MPPNDPGPLPYAGHVPLLDRLARERGADPASARQAVNAPVLRAIDSGAGAVSSASPLHRQMIFDQQIMPALRSAELQHAAATAAAQHVARHYGLAMTDESPMPRVTALGAPMPGQPQGTDAPAVSENWYGQRPKVSNPWTAHLRPQPGPDYGLAIAREGGPPVSPAAAIANPPPGSMPGNPWGTPGENERTYQDMASRPLVDPSASRLQSVPLPDMLTDEAAVRMMGAADPSHTRPGPLPWETQGPMDAGGFLPPQGDLRNPPRLDRRDAADGPFPQYFRAQIPPHLAEPPKFEPAPQAQQQAGGQADDPGAGDGGEGQGPDGGGVGGGGPGKGRGRRGR